MRPQSLDELVGQEHLVGPGKPLRALIEADRLSSIILWGPAGTGKTTIARLIAGATSRAFESLSAVTAGVKDVREVIDRARRRLGAHGQGTILFLDEIHRFNKAQQDALLPAVEEGLVTLIGATTENPYFEVNSALLSRCQIYTLETLTDAELLVVVGRGATELDADVPEEVAQRIAQLAGGDARNALNILELAWLTAQAEGLALESRHAEE